jgi:hypothetical protein
MDDDRVVINVPQDLPSVVVVISDEISPVDRVRGLEERLA